MTALTGLPLCLLAFGLAIPLVALDGGQEYVLFLWSNPLLVAWILAAWGVLLHWTTRRLAAVLLLRSSGAKLKVPDAA